MAWPCISGRPRPGGASTITLDTGAPATDDFFNRKVQVCTLSGTGAKQCREIRDYVGSTRVATVDVPWVTNPSSGTTFVLLPSSAGTYLNAILPRNVARDNYPFKMYNAWR